MKMTWTQPICDTCWVKREPDRNPVRVKEPEGPIEMCAFCGMPTGTGIYVRHDPRTLALTVGHLRRALEEFGWNLPDDAQVIIELNEGEGPMGEFEHPARLVQRLELDGKPVLYVTDSSLSSSAQAISPVRWDDDYHSDDVIPDPVAFHVQPVHEEIFTDFGMAPPEMSEPPTEAELDDFFEALDR